MRGSARPPIITLAATDGATVGWSTADISVGEQTTVALDIALAGIARYQVVKNSNLP